MHRISVSIVYATAKQQWFDEFTVQRGTSAYELIEMSGLLNKIDALNDTPINELNIGVFAQKVTADYLLEEGDRVEIYRPLSADPKEVRRQLALLGKTIGGKNKA